MIAKTHAAPRRSRLAWTFVALLVLGLCDGRLVTTASAQDVTKGTTTPAAGGSRDGIQVHGHWVIEIREPDGRLVSRREFENALEASGQSFLASLLTRQVVAGPWMVVLSDRGINNGATVGFLFCQRELIGNFPGCTAGGELIVAPSTSGTIALGGTLVAAQVVNVSSVETVTFGCAPGNLSCYDTSALKVFTGRTIPAPPSVTLGQIVQVSVTIGFSSPPPTP